MKIYSIHKSSKNTIRGFQARRTRKNQNVYVKSLMASFSKIFDKIDENPFLFQIIGISILTVAILISFQSLADFSVTPVSASPYEVRMLTNFQSVRGQQAVGASKIEEIELTKPEITALEKVKLTRYEVKQGDTLSAISSDVGISIGDLIEINNLEISSQLKIGQILNLAK
jgi:LysM repeat protein